MSTSDPFAVLQPWLDALPQGVLAFAPGGHLVFASAQARRWMGDGSFDIEELGEQLTRAGWIRDGGRSARFARGSELLELSLESRPDGSHVATLLPVDVRHARKLQFLSAAAHDLRAPLANAKAYASLLLHPKWGLEERVRQGLEVVRRNADKALSLSNEIFDSLRAELLPLDTDVRVHDLGKLVQAAVTRARARAVEREVGLEADIPQALPSWPLDAERLSHALDAVLEHAVERSYAHAVCRIQVSQGRDAIFIEVTDGGLSLPESERAELFDRDVRVSLVSRLDVGFRLSLAREEVRALGGDLLAEPLETGALRLKLVLDRRAAESVASVER